MASKAGSGDAFHIGGIPIKFPCKPYGTQLSMMAKIIKGIDRRQNCLLESPTGSGKSLALLCSSLGWQDHEHQKQVIAQGGNESAAVNECDPGAPCSECSCGNQDEGLCIDLTNDSDTSPGPDGGSTNHQGTAPVGVDETDDAADFQPLKMNIRTPRGKLQNKAMGVVFDEDGKEPNMPTTSALKPPVNSCSCTCHKKKDICEETENDSEEKIRLPKIFFGTRTHKQIAQIIRELKKTAYANAKMAILGSREHLCVHPEVSRSKNKNDGCRELLDSKNGISCRFHNGVQKMKFHWQLAGLGLTSAWDVEDLVKMGKRIKACSYFASRSLANDADIVFCPYNYLIDPLIRSSMEISLKGHIVILDEAHNIEDSAREAASVTVMADELQDTIDELDRLINYRWREEHCRVIHTVVAQLQRWINSHTNSLSQNDFSKASRVWTGVEMVAAFSTMGITPASFDTLRHHAAALFEEANPQIPVEQTVALTSASGMLIKGIFIVVDYFFRENMVYMKDYKVVLIKEISRRKWQEETNNRWVNPRRGSHERFTFSLNFWCMNPAVAFSDVGGEARSIILTSGTLSPMSSFASELGVEFAVSLEANHVIKDNQVWVGSIATGPTGKTLNASYRNTETFNFQDDLGKLVLDVCSTVPYGVLCFLSSYSLMLKLSERWKNTGLWDKLENLKVVMTEARGGQKKEFDEQLKEFYLTIQEFEREDLGSQPRTGVLFFAVCRGKVSEGMDFADNNARAVITVGIPFPSFKDPQVELKRAYNDQNRERGLLSGSEWYEIQAYRALNQALGRCLRHKNDWGALILVDERFRRNPQKYISGLSKWVRSKVKHFLHSADGMGSLRNFVIRQQNTVNNDGSSPTADETSLSVMSTPSVMDRGPQTPSTSSSVTPMSRPAAVLHGFPGISITARTPGTLSSHQQPVTPASIERPSHAPTSSPQAMMNQARGSSPTKNETMVTPSWKRQETPSTSATPLSRPTAVMHGFPGISVRARTPGSQFVRQQPVTPASIGRTPQGSTSGTQITILERRGSSDSSPQSLVSTQLRPAVENSDSDRRRTTFIPHDSGKKISPLSTGLEAATSGKVQEMMDKAETSSNVARPGAAAVSMGESHSDHSDGSAASNPVPSTTARTSPPPQLSCTEPPTCSSVLPLRTKTTPSTSDRGKSLRQTGLQSFGFHCTQRNATKLDFVNAEPCPENSAGVMEKERSVREGDISEISDRTPCAMQERGTLDLTANASSNRELATRALSPPPDTSTPPPLFCIEESDDDADLDSSITREGFDKMIFDHKAPDVEKVADEGQQDVKASVILNEEQEDDKARVIPNEEHDDDIRMKTEREEPEITCIEGDEETDSFSWVLQEQSNKIPSVEEMPKRRTPARKATKSKLSRSSKRQRDISNREGESVVEVCERNDIPLIRRSKRRRRRSTHWADMKTETEESTEETVALVSCRRCEAELCVSGISRVPAGDIQSQYLTAKLLEHSTKRTSPRKQNLLKLPDKNSILLKIDLECLSNMVVKQFKRRGLDDQNAHWSEEDQCCYQPVVCSNCVHTGSGTATVIGHKVVCIGDGPIKSGLNRGQIWLLPASVALS